MACPFLLTLGKVANFSVLYPGYPDGALSLSRNLYEQFIVLAFFEHEKSNANFGQYVEQYFLDYDIRNYKSHIDARKWTNSKHEIPELESKLTEARSKTDKDTRLHATISDRKLRRPPGRKLLAYRIDREPLPPCKVRVKGQPLRGGLTRQAGWHGGHSQSIPAAISCKHQHTTGGRPCLIYAGSMTRISRKML